MPGRWITVTCDDGGVILALQNLPKAASRSVVIPALMAGGQPIVTAAKGNIHNVSGLLAGGLKLRVGKNNRPGRLAVLMQSWTTRQTFATKGRRRKVAEGRGRDRYKVYYGPPLEYGREDRAGRIVGKHPWAGPAFDATGESAATDIEVRIGDGIAALF